MRFLWHNYGNNFFLLSGGNQDLPTPSIILGIRQSIFRARNAAIGILVDVCFSLSIQTLCIRL